MVWDERRVGCSGFLMRTLLQYACVGFVAVFAAAPPALAEIVSVNFYHSTAVVGPSERAGLVVTSGWNDLKVPGGFGLVDPAAAFGPTIVTNAAGASVALLSSTLGSYYNGDSGTSATGLNAGLMSEYVAWDTDGDAVLPDDTGTITVSGLGSAFTGPGYDVYVLFDADANNRTFAITIGTETQVGSDASTFNGVLRKATGAGADSSYAVFRGLTADAFSIELDSSSGRAALNGLQIVSADHPAPVNRPHVVVFLVDDMGWLDTSEPFHSEATVWNGLYYTPNMELLADRGLKFTQAYAASPVCSPSRASLLTGRNPGRTGITNWTSTVGQNGGSSILADADWTSEGLQPGDGNTTLPAILRQHGYLTAHVGKAHLGAEDTSGADPVTLGFDINVVGSAAGYPPSYFPEPRGLDRLPGLEAYQGTGTYLGEALTLEAGKIIDQAVDANMPLFLHLSHYLVHAPLSGQGDPAVLPAYPGLPDPEDDYAAMLESMDASLGAILAKLEQRGIANQTLVLFASDNGGLSALVRYDSLDASEPWHVHEHNRPLASGKGSSYEGGLRIPLIAAWAGQASGQPAVQPDLPIPPGSTSDEPIHFDDLFPTLLSATGIPNPASYLQDVDGEDLTPLLSASGGFARSGPLLWHYPHQWIWEPGDGPGIEPFTAVREGDWKLVYFYVDERWELYDLSSDLEEAVNLATRETERVHQLGSDMIGWMSAVGANRPRDAATLQEVPPPALPPPGCNDGLDNDGDGRVDLADPGCEALADLSEWSALLTCDDGLDNDGDGFVDFGADPGCASPLFGLENPQCQDGLDNDGQPGIDFDGGVSILGVGNGDPDGADPQCASFFVNREAAPARSCGLGPELAGLLPLIAWLRALRRRTREWPRA